MAPADPAVCAFAEFAESAWNDHADRPEAVAQRLADSFHVIGSVDDAAGYARLIAHVHGEHLGQWDAAIALLGDMARRASHIDDASLGKVVEQHCAVLRYAGGDASALHALPHDERIAALASSASMLAGREAFARALPAYAEALHLATPGLRAGSPALRALAVAGNNLAAALEQKPDRDGAETAAMIAAAEGALKYWRLAGTWLEEERAQYRLARSLLQAGEPDAAALHGMQCIELCVKHEAPALELFFGHAVLALARRAAHEHAAFEASRRQALDCLESLAADERQWYAADLAELSDQTC
jgi:HEPN domain-containing protein